MLRKHHWWQDGVVYQIYPRSFMDGNNDGVGDLAGIRARLDYLAWLGVDAIWISPIYPSPMSDFGYDVSDYTDIHPLFGSLADFDALLAEAHARRLRVILDFVPNHTSDQHPWFTESRSSRDNPKRDWFIWRDPAPDGGPPNNWLSNFGGSGWEYDAQRDQYYYHAFLKEQPDLNWRNPQVQDAMLDAMRFWLDRGVDGFRIDVIWHLIKDKDFRENPVNPEYHAQMGEHRRLLATYNTDRPEVHDVIERMRNLLDSYEDRMMVGEIYLPVERLVTYYGTGGRGVHLPFNFQLIGMAWDAQLIRTAVDQYEAALPPHGWPNWVLGNHDNHRIASRIGVEQARVAAMLLLTLRGTPTLYYGDEIGMRDVPILPEQVQDPLEKNMPGLGLGRDPERSPMQWDNSLHAGFSLSTPWLPIADDYPQVNVAAAQRDKHSLLHLYRKLILLRDEWPALAVGSYRGFSTSDQVFGYLREHDDQRLLVLLNFSAKQQLVDLGSMLGGYILLSTGLVREGEPVAGTLLLDAHEGVIVCTECNG
ncbi:alpha-amylase family glycosyl hydrolase [Chitiniphilus purpureus]|uniref:Alpha-amylase family glycosyl hydrolase n=1 Tax=Chitiniphilus purpureus TaxID=2981137 RepID=A0ABY6DJW1_9NEIS|nr:alpha-amylase family glycosyl hydrolase [Chitiniphilus sp. CD1]UXY14645.1 alpha-amylase family glycosyl hydrolase [Chitiniphilus sp. CD1]